MEDHALIESKRAYERAKLSWHVDSGVIIMCDGIVCHWDQGYSMWRVERRGPLGSGRLAWFIDHHRCGNLTVSSFCVVPPSFPWRFVFTSFAIHASSWSVSLLSLKCHSLFSLNWVRNWAQWHISAPWLCSTGARTALAGFLKMCLKCYPSVMLQQ